MRALNGEHVAVAVVGAGPAGLSAAVELRRRGVGSVLVIEREQQAGGIPRHADHQGFGLRDLRRVLPGPEYARHLAERARRAGVALRLGTQVTGWRADGALELTGPAGRTVLVAEAVVLATGCRERPRSARLIPGTRPQGVMTTGTLQQLVHLDHEPVGRRAVVAGAEHVAFSALATLAHAGARTVAMTTELAHHQSFPGVAMGAAVRYRVPLHTRTRVSAIFGTERVTAVELTDLDSGTARRVACDLIVLTADWIPDHELAVAGGASLDPGTRGPAVDHALRTTRLGTFAVGNLLHGAEPADVAALTGRRVAAGVIAHLAGGPWPHERLPVTVEAPLHWIAPNALCGDRGEPGFSPRDAFRLRAREEVRDVRLEVRQGVSLVYQQRLVRVMPGRSVTLRGDWVARVDTAGPALAVRVGTGRRRRPRRGKLRTGVAALRSRSVAVVDPRSGR
ncbi:MAG: NAD(P)/FAD-dependent oxidoreductase [Solirubrobacteraceae bacterium]